MATNRTSPKKGKVVDIPDAVVTIGTPTAGDAQVSVAFTATAPATGGPVQKYTAISSPGSVTVSGSTSPVVVTGLTNGTAYTFTVAAANATGNGVFSSASASTTPAVQSAFESIATVSVGSGGQSSISFTSIPSTYKHLQIRWMARDNRNSADGDAMKMTFNSDTASNYYGGHWIAADGSTVTAYAEGAYSNIWIERIPNTNSLANAFGIGVMDVFDYANVNKNKVTRYMSGADVNGAFGTNNLRFASGMWMSTSAISSITITPNVGTLFSQYSSFALYGIKG